MPSDQHVRKEVGLVKKGKAPAKKPTAEKAKTAKVKAAKPAKLSHRPKP